MDKASPLDPPPNGELIQADLFADEEVRNGRAIQQISLLMPDQLESLGFRMAARLAVLAGVGPNDTRMAAAELLESGIPLGIGDLLPLCDALQKNLFDGQGEGEVGYWAATLIGRLGSQNGVAHRAQKHLGWNAAVDVLRHALVTGGYLPARERAAWALGQIGQPARDAMPILRRTAEDAPPRLKRLAIEALESIRGVAA